MTARCRAIHAVVDVIVIVGVIGSPGAKTLQQVLPDTDTGWTERPGDLSVLPGVRLVVESESKVVFDPRGTKNEHEFVHLDIPSVDSLCNAMPHLAVLPDERTEVVNNHVTLANARRIDEKESPRGTCRLEGVFFIHRTTGVRFLRGEICH